MKTPNTPMIANNLTAVFIWYPRKKPQTAIKLRSRHHDHGESVLCVSTEVVTNRVSGSRAVDDALACAAVSLSATC